MAISKKVKFDGARCPFSTVGLRLQGDHHCACAQKWCHFSFFSQELVQTKKKIKALRPKMTKIASRGGPALSQLNKTLYIKMPTNSQLQVNGPKSQTGHTAVQFLQSAARFTHSLDSECCIARHYDLQCGCALTGLLLFISAYSMTDKPFANVYMHLFIASWYGCQCQIRFIC